MLPVRMSMVPKSIVNNFNLCDQSGCKFSSKNFNHTGAQTTYVLDSDTFAFFSCEKLNTF